TLAPAVPSGPRSRAAGRRKPQNPSRLSADRSDARARGAAWRDDRACRGQPPAAVTRMARLSRRTLAALPADIRRPGFDPARLDTGVVHLGIGAFARAHLACYTEPLLAADPRWGILGVSLRRPDTRDALAPQDWLYACAERDGDGERIAAMAPLTGVLAASENPKETIARLADPAVRIASLTVTEKGYCRDAASGDLDEDDPAIRHDLANRTAPHSVPGIPPFTVLSCD